MTWQGCELPRQPVDHRHRRVLRQLHQRRVVEDADHDRIDVARQDPRRVGDRLAAAELHLLAGEHDRLAAELAHRDVEGDARARRGLSKIIASTRPSSGRVARRAARAFMRRAVVEDRAAASPRDRSARSRKCRWRAHRTASALTRRPSRRVSRERSAASSRSIASSISASSTISGGRRRTTLSPAVHDEQSLRRAPRPRARCSACRHFRPSISPSPRTSSISAGCASTSRRASASAAVPYRRTCSRKPGAEHDVEHGIADRHGERIAAEGRAMACRRSCRSPPPRWRGTRRAGSRRRCPWRSP